MNYVMPFINSMRSCFRGSNATDETERAERAAAEKAERIELLEDELRRIAVLEALAKTEGWKYIQARGEEKIRALQLSLEVVKTEEVPIVRAQIRVLREVIELKHEQARAAEISAELEGLIGEE